MTEAAPDRSYRALFRIPTLGRIVLSMQIARTAQSMLSVALVLFTLAEYDSPGLAGIVTFASIFPGLVMSPIAGALLDRHGRVRLIVVDYAVALVSLALIGGLALAGLLPAWLLVLIALVSSVTGIFSHTGLRSLFPVLVPRHLWERVNAIDSNGYVIATIIGPPLAAALVATVGGPPTILAIAVAFGVAGLVMFRVPEPHVETATTGRLLHDAWQGLRYFWNNPTLRGLGFSLSIVNLAAGMTTIVIPLVVIDVLGAGQAAVGLVSRWPGSPAWPPSSSSAGWTPRPRTPDDRDPDVPERGGGGPDPARRRGGRDRGRAGGGSRVPGRPLARRSASSRARSTSPSSPCASGGPIPPGWGARSRSRWRSTSWGSRSAPPRPGRSRPSRCPPRWGSGSACLVGGTLAAVMVPQLIAVAGLATARRRSRPGSRRRRRGISSRTLSACITIRTSSSARRARATCIRSSTRAPSVGSRARRCTRPPPRRRDQGLASLPSNPRVAQDVSEVVLRYFLKLNSVSATANLREGLVSVADALSYRVAVGGDPGAGTDRGHVEIGVANFVVRERNPARERVRFPLEAILAISPAVKGRRADTWAGLAFGGCAPRPRCRRSTETWSSPTRHPPGSSAWRSRTVRACSRRGRAPTTTRSWPGGWVSWPPG